MNFRILRFISGLAGTACVTASAQSLPANASTVYSAVIHFDRSDYVVENRYGPTTPTESAAGLETAIVFNQGAFMEPDATGHMNLPANFGERVSFVASAAPQAKLTLGVFSLHAIAGNATAIQTFIGELQSLIATHGFRGVDIDWEDMPNAGTYTSPTVYGQTIKAISDVLRPQGIVVSTSHAQGAQYEPYAAAVANAVDYVNIQFYFASTNAMDLATFKSRLAAYVNRGLKASQIRVGLPSYGMVASSANTSDKWRSWDCLRNAGVNLTSSNQWTDPTNGQVYYYSGLNLIDSKVHYAMTNGFAGVFTWELTQDTSYSHPLSINRFIDNLAMETPVLELNNANSGSGALGTGAVHLGSGKVLNNGVLRLARDSANIYSNVIEGSGRLETGGSSNSILTGASTYTGGTRVAAGSRLNLGNGAAAGSVTGPIEILGTLAINRSDNITLNNPLSGTGTFVKSGVGRLTLHGGEFPATLATFSISGGSVENTGDFAFPNNVLIGDAYTGSFVQNTGTVTFSTTSADWGAGVNIAHRIGGIGRYDLGGGVLNVPNAPVILTSGPSNGTFAITGGTANLKGLAMGTSASGTARLHLTGGRLNLGANGISNWTPPNSDGVRELQFGAATLGATADWSCALTATITDSATGLTINTGDTATPAVARHITLSGPISGTGKLTLTGPGSLTLAGINTYGGGTTVAGGTLSLSGSLTSPATVADLGKLAGSGSISAAVTIEAGGTLAPDAGATLATGTLTLAAGSTLMAEGITTVVGDINVGGSHLVAITIPDASPHVLVAYTGDRSGEFTTTSLPAGWQLQYDESAREIRLVSLSDPYLDWIGGFATKGQSGFTNDADGDGISNGLEFYLGGEPTTAGDTELPALSPATTGGFIYRFTRSVRARSAGIAVVRFSGDLVQWPIERDIVIDANSVTTDVVTINDQGDQDLISIIIPGDAQRTFVRLEFRHP